MRASAPSLDPLTPRAVGLGALLHDVGKLLTPERGADEASSLTHEERAVVTRPTVRAACFPHLAAAAKIVRAHHERPDGTGYPDGLTAAEIPAGASIASVGDAWDAMVSDRPYGEGIPAERAEAILRHGAGTQWWDDAVELVLAEIHIGGVAPPGRLDRVGELAPTKTGELRIDPFSACLPRFGRLPTSP